MKYFLVPVTGCCDPDTLGPFETAERRDEKAKEIRAGQRDGEDALFWADVNSKGTLLVGAYEAGFFEDEDSAEFQAKAIADGLESYKRDMGL